MIGQSSNFQSSNLLIAEEPIPKVEVAEVKPIVRSKRIPALDGLRGIAILMVLFQHFYWTMGWSVPIKLSYPFLSSILSKFTFFSARGVDLFFVLSGFLLTGILLDSKGRDHYFKNFYMRRILRIFPLYYGVLAAIFLIIPLMARRQFPQFSEQGPYWIFLGNFVPLIEVPGVKIAHFWSLAVQEQLYLVLPLIVFVLSRRALQNLLIGVIVLTPIFRLTLNALNISFYWYLLPAVADQFAAGGLIAIWFRKKDGSDWLRGIACKSSFFIAPLVLLAWTMPRRWQDWWFDPFSHSTVTISFALGLVFSITLFGKSIIARFLNTKFLVVCGKYSFGMYVFHFLLLPQYKNLAIHFGFFKPTPPSTIVILLIIGVGIVSIFLISWLSWHLYEKHFIKLKAWF